MTKVYRMENEKHYGPFVDTLDAREFVKHVHWAKAVQTDASADGWGVETNKTHPHHMEDIPNAEMLNYADDPFAMLFGLAPVDSRWKVGTSDLKQFYHWFPKDSLDYFASLGHHLSIWDVPDGSIHKGKYQLMFDSSKAKLVQEVPLDKIEEAK